MQICWGMVNSSATFGNLMEFFLSIFDPWLVETIDAEPADMEGWL